MKTLQFALIEGLILWVPCPFTGSINLQITPSVSAGRVALVIGNANYFTGPLKNAINDTKDMARDLSELGFEVNYKEDVRRR